MTTAALDPETARGPQYLRIYRDLKRRIQSGELPPDSPLPSQRELSRQFDVTLMTLRQAIHLLKEECLVVTRQGAGTRVAPKRFSYAISPLRSLAQVMESEGLTMTTRVLRSREQPAGVIADELQIGQDDPVLSLQRLRLVDGRPLVFQCSYLPAWIGRGVVDADLSINSLYDVLTDRFGYEVECATERIQATVLGKREARLLAAAPGKPAMLSERITYLAGNRAVLYDRAYLPGDRLVISVERTRSNVALNYELRNGRAVSSTRSIEDRRRIV